jgi:hypothetical protein
MHADVAITTSSKPAGIVTALRTHCCVRCQFCSSTCDANHDC